MRTRRTVLLAVIATALSLGASTAHAAVLYDQTDHDAGEQALSTQQSATTPTNGDYFVADDFVVPSGQRWSISEVDVVSGSTTSGNAAPVSVVIYANSGTSPGQVVFSEPDVAATNFPNYHVPLTGAPVLQAGHYWVSVFQHGSQAQTGGLWYWENRSTQSNLKAVAKQPGQSTCSTSWDLRTFCYSESAPDQLFSLQGNLEQSVTVSKTGAGSGRVTSSPGGIDCGSQCTGMFANGSPMALHATPDAGSVFSGWSGSGCSGTGNCTITPSADSSVTATFSPAPPPSVHCAVPNLKGKTLGKARTLLTAAHCTLGKVKKPKHAKGKLVVKSQSPSAGTVLANGGSVSVKLGPKPHHKKK